MAKPLTGRQQVTRYIERAPRAAQPMLRELRRIVRECAPRAIEKLSYGVPYYGHLGRLIYFAAFRRHVSLYVMGRSKLRFAREMKPHQTSPSTLRFAHGTRIPAGLVKRLIRARMRENQSKSRRA